MNRFDDLPEHTKEFLTNLRQDELATLSDGIRLVNAIRTVGTFMKWLIVGVLGFVVGVVMLGENIAKFLGWFRS